MPMPLLFLAIPLAFLSYFIFSYESPSEVLYSAPWVAPLGIFFSFSLNKLGLFMGLLVAFIGTVITFYATQYMKNVKDRYRFWIFFMAFMIAMIGLVLSENLITLFLFWEATSICSFFLIGHFYDDEGARRGALNSLLITGGGGIFLLIGFIILGLSGGSYEISALIQNKETILAAPTSFFAFAFIMIGIMTKSAQFPLHFWLPMAMTGPAPVSSFLHSATMVKAGVFLLARLFPLFSGISLWEPVLVTIGLATFIWGGGVAIRQFDFKKILANTTISALGCLSALMGMAKSYEKALEAFFLFFIAHAFYKAALFMCAGIIEKKFKKKDIRETRLNFTDDPLLAITLVISCLSMMGLPPTMGFIGKETFLDFSRNNLVYLLPLMAGGILNFVAAGKIIYFLFFAQRDSQTAQSGHSSALLSMAPFVLALGTITLTFLGPWGLNEFIVQLTSEISERPTTAQIALWHGFNIPLLLSLVTIVCGTLLLLPLKRAKHSLKEETLSALAPTQLYLWLFERLLWGARIVSGHYQSGFLRRYFIIIFSASSILIFLGILYFAPAIQYVNSPIHFVDICIGLIIVFSTIATLATHSKIWAVTQIGIVGTCLIIFFIFYGAPDLALTQLLVEIFTLTIFVFALHRLPRLKSYSGRKVYFRDFILSAVFGLLMGGLTYLSFGTQMEKSVASFYSESAFLEAQGKNIVNVILVDFRSFDTLGEISVILMAALGVYILMRKRGTS